MDAKKYDRQVELVDITDAQELAVKIVMQEGALRFQDQVLTVLKEKKLYKAAKVVEAVELEL
jgi:hypothetical protein